MRVPIEDKLKENGCYTSSLGRVYRVTCSLGHGDGTFSGDRGNAGQAVVYAATDENGKEFALKVQSPESPHSAYAFLREARAAEPLRGLENIVCACDSGVSSNGLAWIVSELVEGEHFVRWAARKDWRTIAAVGGAIAEALHRAHEKRVFHRDLKSENILVDENDVPYLLDFGCAKWATTGDGATQMVVVGTANTASPEQLDDPDKADERSDLYSLGVVLYEAVTQHAAFPQNALVNAQAKLRAQWPCLRSRQFGKHQGMQDLGVVISRCTAFCPEQRYQTAQDLADDLKRVSRNEHIAATPFTTAERLTCFKKRRPLAAFSAVGGLISLVIILVLVLHSLQLRSSSNRSNLLALRRQLLYDVQNQRNVAADELNNGNPGDAIASLRAALAKLSSAVGNDLEISATRGSLYGQLGEVYMFAGHPEKAGVALQNAAKELSGVVDRNPDWRFSLGTEKGGLAADELLKTYWTWTEIEQIELSKDDLKPIAKRTGALLKYASLSRLKAPLLRNLAVRFYSARQFSEARQFMTQSMNWEENPNDQIQSRSFLAMAALQEGKFEDAVKNVADVRAAAPLPTAIDSGIGLLHLHIAETPGVDAETRDALFREAETIFRRSEAVPISDCKYGMACLRMAQSRIGNDASKRAEAEEFLVEAIQIARALAEVSVQPLTLSPSGVRKDPRLGDLTSTKRVQDSLRELERQLRSGPGKYVRSPYTIFPLVPALRLEPTLGPSGAPIRGVPSESSAKAQFTETSTAPQ